MKNNKKCKHYREEGVGADLDWVSGCTCNNDLDDVGECIYGDGVIRVKPVCKYYEEFFALLESYAKQYLYDIDTEDFESMDNHFNNEPYDLLGCTDETMEKIIEFAETTEKREQK